MSTTTLAVSWRYIGPENPIPQELILGVRAYDFPKSRRLASIPLRTPIILTMLGQLKTGGGTCVLADATETILRLCLDSKPLEKAIIPQSRPPPTTSGTNDCRAAARLDRRKPTAIKSWFTAL